MGRIEQSIEVNAPKHVCFEQWCRFEEFPRFMKNVESIRHKGRENVWEWRVRGPLGQSVSWDAEMNAQRPDEVVSWHTVRNSEVEHAGAVTFEEIRPDYTRINVRIEYHAPAGALGDLVANIFKNPERMVQEDLNNFKALVEGHAISPDTVKAGTLRQKQQEEGALYGSDASFDYDRGDIGGDLPLHEREDSPYGPERPY